MCHIYAHRHECDYAYVPRSVRLNGYVTSIRLEALFWRVLDEMAEAEGVSTPKFIATLYDEVMAAKGVVGNFSSLLRIACLIYLENRGRADARRAPGAALAAAM